MSNAVFVLDHDHCPLKPVHPAVARRMLTTKQAAVFRRYPFTKTSVKPRPSGRGYKEVGPSAGQFPVDAARQFLLRHRRTF